MSVDIALAFQRLGGGVAASESDGDDDDLADDDDCSAELLAAGHVGAAQRCELGEAVPRAMGIRRLPEGVSRRSAAHMHIMRQAKRLRSSENVQHQSEQTLVNLGHAWNQEMGLRHGDRVGQPLEAHHPNAWSHDGLVNVGWNEVGGHGLHGLFGNNGVGESRRCIDALMVLASCTIVITSNCVEEFLA